MLGRLRVILEYLQKTEVWLFQRFNFINEFEMNSSASPLLNNHFDWLSDGLSFTTNGVKNSSYNSVEGRLEFFRPNRKT